MSNTGLRLFGASIVLGGYWWYSRQPKISVTSNNAAAKSISFVMSWEGQKLEDTIFANDEEQVIAAGTNRWFISSADADGATLTIAENLNPETGTYAVVEASYVPFASAIGGIAAWEDVTILEISNSNPLSKQLMELTGDSWNASDFRTLDDKEPTTEDVFIHVPSGQKFYVKPNSPVFEYSYSYNGKYYVTTNEELTGQGVFKSGNGEDHRRGLKTYFLTKAALDRYLSIYPNAKKSVK